MQEVQRANAELETERIDLQVRLSKYKREMDELAAEKENVQRKYAACESALAREQRDRAQVDAALKRQFEALNGELYAAQSECAALRVERDSLRAEIDMLHQYRAHNEQLTASNQQLTAHYEQLYEQASEIVAGNQLLNEQCATSAAHVEALSAELGDVHMQLDQLQSANSTLNLAKTALQLRCDELEEHEAQVARDTAELATLRAMRGAHDQRAARLHAMSVELADKSELIEQLAQAKEFLAENNSKLLMNNMRIQLFVESAGLDLGLMETSARLSEYDTMSARIEQMQRERDELEAANVEYRARLDELIERAKTTKRTTQQLDAEAQTAASVVHDREAQTERVEEKVEEKEKTDQEEQAVTSETTAAEATPASVTASSISVEHYNDLLGQYEYNFNMIQSENDTLLAEIEALRLRDSDERAKWSSLQASYDALAAKMTALEQQNLKYKAKLKQLLTAGAAAAAKRKDSTSRAEQIKAELKETPPPAPAPKKEEQEKETPASQPQVVIEHMESERLVTFGARLAIHALLQRRRVETPSNSELEQRLKATYETRLGELEQRLADAERQRDSFKLELDRRRCQTLDAEHQQQQQHVDALLAQLEQVNAQIASERRLIDELTRENDSLSASQAEARDANAALVTTHRVQLAECEEKLAGVERQNLKYKAKLKQLLGAAAANANNANAVGGSKRQQATSSPLTIDVTSLLTAAASSSQASPLAAAAAVESNATQTEEDTSAGAEAEAKRAAEISEWRARVAASDECVRSVRAELAALHEQSRQRDDEHAAASAQLRDTLDKTQSQNLKLRAKVKQLMHKNNNATSSSSSSVCPSPGNLVLEKKM